MRLVSCIWASCVSFISNASQPIESRWGFEKLDQEEDVNADAVRSLAELLSEMNLTEIEYQTGSLRIRVARTVVQQIVPLNAASVTAAGIAGPMVAANAIAGIATSTSTGGESADLENHPGVIEAQMVGTVYLSPGPGTPPFISVGGAVSQGDTLFIIEAMKVMNMIKSPRSGTVKHIFVKDSQPIEYGDPIVIID
ncbi:MAG: acetyl-CoA carboxylase, biotin carboxyl carrier protein [Holosporaceae bacterium]|jgi:acetyl-CoA carboxylase biotin carboxyl carrier protein|nr:acetyl-CoA carboxylase, biotin carboxyl carrier protein [Holosporaceae bacterium]